MRKLGARLCALLAMLALGLPGPAALAQGVAPGGPIGNSTGIGSGWGAPPGGTAPTYPNGTQPPTLPPPPPPGGGLAPLPPPPTISTARPPSYPQPLAPFGPPAPHAAASAAGGALVLPPTPTGSLSFLKGCWRSDVFRYAREPGTATYCFNETGAGRFLYSRLDRPDFFCRAAARASYVEGALRLHNSATRCSDGSGYPDTLDCRPSAGEPADCSTKGDTESWTVHLRRIR